MHDLRAIRADPAAFDAAMARRGIAPQADGILRVDLTLREHQKAEQDRNAQTRSYSTDIATAARRGDLDAVEKTKVLAQRHKENAPDYQAQGIDLEDRRSRLLDGIPNILDTTVPDGVDETGNIELHRNGDPAQSNVARQHFELGETLGLMDFEAAARLSGSRFVVLRGALARLERAPGQWMLDQHITHNGYTEIAPPYLVNAASLYGTGQLPKFEEDLFRTGDKYLIPTAEVPLTNLVAGQIIAEPIDPLRFTALTPSFRSEAGSAGRDTRGMLRQHQFHKVEMVSVTRPEDSDAEHERMTACAEAILTALGLTWRRMLLCAGDTGFSAAKTYDLEVWLPGQQAWREISSCSNCHAFQARRMNTRFKRGKETVFVHTLNGSGVAVGRALIAVMETHQQGDGAVIIPEPLLPYMGGVSRLDGSKLSPP